MSKSKLNQPPPISEIELPEGWINTTIGNLCSVQKDKGHEGVVPYVEIGNIDIKSKEYEITEKPSVKGCRLAKRNDILVSRVRPTRGAITWIKEDEIEVSSAFTVLRNLGGLADRYLWFYLAFNEQFLNYLGARCTGTMYPTTSDEVVIGFDVPLAPLMEQERIVAKMETLIKRVNAVRARLAKMPAILKRFRQSVLAAACSGQLTAEWHKNLDSDINDDILPNGWTTATLSDLASKEPRSIQSGPFGSNLLHSEFQKTGVLAIGIDNVLHGKFSLGREHRISSDKFEELSKYQARPGDVLITVMATVGRVCVVPDDLEPAIITKHVYRITPERTLLEPRYLMYSLMGDPLLTSELSEQIRGQTRPGINGTILKGLHVRLPSLNEQREIVHLVEALFTLADRIEAKIRAATIRADRLPQAILARAFRGELVPTEAELAAKEGRDYEPASVLLERIQEARKQHKPVKRGRGGKNMAKHSTGREKARKRKPLDECLREQGKPMTPERLFDLAGFDESSVDDFYEQLRKLIQEGKIRENRPNKKDVTLEVAGT